MNLLPNMNTACASRRATRLRSSQIEVPMRRKIVWE
jgi:hypothetical protein